MRILFTGSSSFTGLWFIQELVGRGYEVTASFRQPRNGYEGLRAERVDRVCDATARAVFDCPFGSPLFLELLEADSWDILCHHGAEAMNYRSVDFDILSAVKSNTQSLRAVLQKRIAKVILTGSVFAPGEGIGSDDLRAVSPYGVSKGLTTEIFRFYCHAAQVPLTRFVIPNPFGPYEEPRFVGYVLQQWLRGEVAEVKYPLYVRDNIPVSLLAKGYVHCCEGVEEQFHPTGYVDSQGEFTERLAQEMRKRWKLPCDYICHEQIEFPEPAVRVNTDVVDGEDWNEERAWDELAGYYQRRHRAEAL